MQLQLRLFPHWRSLTLLSPEMQIFFELKPDQIEEIEKLSDANFEKVKEVWSDLREQVVAANQRREERVLQVLTPQQRDKLEEALDLVRAASSSPASGQPGREIRFARSIDRCPIRQPRTVSTEATSPK